MSAVWLPHARSRRVCRLYRSAVLHRRTACTAGIRVYRRAVSARTTDAFALHLVRASSCISARHASPRAHVANTRPPNDAPAERSTHAATTTDARPSSAVCVLSADTPCSGTHNLQRHRRARRQRRGCWPPSRLCLPATHRSGFAPMLKTKSRCASTASSTARWTLLTSGWRRPRRRGVARGGGSSDAAP